MYLELVTTVVAIQRDLACIYAASGRMGELGAYFIALNYTTLKFFEQIEPPPKCTQLHVALLKWETLGLEALAEELEAGVPINSETTCHFAEAAQEFNDALSAFARSAQVTADQ